MAEPAVEDVPPPHAGAPAADFVEGDGPVYTLAGHVVVHTDDEAGTVAYWLLLGQGLVKPFHPDLLPLFEFFQTPRTQTQAREWLDWAGGPDYLAELLDHKIVLAVDTRRPWAAAKSLRGLKLVPQTAQGPVEYGSVGVMTEGSEKPVDYVGPELAAVLWGNNLGEDIPKVVKRIARAGRFDRDQAARLILTEVPTLLQRCYARLEWLRVPNA